MPLHIFEPRYCEMIRDTISKDRIIGMVLLKEGWNRHANPNPPIYDVGCAGIITHIESLDDERYNIVLRGFERFRVTQEDQTRAYRLADVDILPEKIAEEDQTQLDRDKQKIKRLLDQQRPGTSPEAKIPLDMRTEDLVNTLSQYLQFEPLEKQALLERLGPSERCKALVDLLEMRLLVSSQATPPSRIQ
jgi:Lon protease-like protein